MVTINIGHWSDSVKYKINTFNNIYSGLIIKHFELPNAPFLNRYWRGNKHSSKNKICLDENSLK